MRNELIKYLVHAAVFSAVAGCGGGGNTTPPPATPQTTTFSGVAVAGSRFSSGAITVYDYSAGTKGNAIANSNIASDGSYTLSYTLSNPPSAVLVQASNGCYIEASYTHNGAIPAAPQNASANPGNPSYVPICLIGTLDAVVVNTTGATKTVAVTPYTHAAVGLIQYKIHNGTTVSTAIAETATAFQQLLGFDPVTTLPAMPQHIQTVSDNTVYGGIIAAIPGWLFNVAFMNQTYTTPATLGTLDLTTLSFAASMQADLAQDGVLNGVGRDQNGNPIALTIAGVPLSTDVYRHGLAKYATIQLRGNFESVVGYTVVDTQRIIPFLPALVGYNNATGLFDATPITPLDEGGPNIVINSPSPGATLTGSGGINAGISDITGVVQSQANLYINGGYYDIFLDPYRALMAINTTIFQNGAYTLRINATNNLGTTNSASVTVNFSN